MGKPPSCRGNHVVHEGNGSHWRTLPLSPLPSPMPEGAMRRELYPENWEGISLSIRRRANGQCECEGFCGLHCGRRCQERQGENAKWANGKVVLTVAHLTHNPQDSRPEYLKAMCQRCHLRYDRLLHAEARLRREHGDLFVGKFRCDP